MSKEIPSDKIPFAYLNEKKTTIISTTNMDAAKVFSLVNNTIVDLYKQFDLFIEDIINLPKDYYLASGAICQERYNRFVKFSSDERQLLFKAFIDKDLDQYKFVLYQRAFKSMSHYIRDIYFEKNNIGVSDDALQLVKEKYPLVPQYMFGKIQEKKFIKQLAPKIIDSLEKELPSILPKIIEHKQQGMYAGHNMYIIILYSILDSFLVSLCSDKYLGEATTDHRHTLVNETLAPIQEKKQTQLAIQQEKEDRKKQREQQVQDQQESNPEQTTIKLPSQQQTFDKEKQQQFQEIFASFENAIKTKLGRAVADVQFYVWRMYKKNESVRMKRIEEILGSLFDTEVISFVEDLCIKLDITVVELEVMGEEAQEIIGGKKTINTLNEKDRETPSLVSKPTSPTLQSITNTPEKLTTEVFMNICKELGYRFWDEKKFKSELKKYLPDNPGSNTSVIQNRIIARVGENSFWEKRSVQGGQVYDRLELHHNVRIIKQGKTIVLIANYDDYMSFVLKYFKSQKRNFDKELGRGDAVSK